MTAAVFLPISIKAKCRQWVCLFNFGLLFQSFLHLRLVFIFRLPFVLQNVSSNTTRDAC